MVDGGAVRGFAARAVAVAVAAKMGRVRGTPEVLAGQRGLVIVSYAGSDGWGPQQPLNPLGESWGGQGGKLGRGLAVGGGGTRESRRSGGRGGKPSSRGGTAGAFLCRRTRGGGRRAGWGRRFRGCCNDAPDQQAVVRNAGCRRHMTGGDETMRVGILGRSSGGWPA